MCKDKTNIPPQSTTAVSEMVNYLMVKYKA